MGSDLTRYTGGLSRRERFALAERQRDEVHNAQLLAARADVVRRVASDTNDWLMMEGRRIQATAWNIPPEVAAEMVRNCATASTAIGFASMKYMGR